jgi:hypothetical protein
VEAAKRAQLEHLALSRLGATAHDDEQWSFLFRTPGARCHTYCPWTVTDDWDFDGSLDDLDLPWTASRWREIDLGDDPSPDAAQQTPYGLTFMGFDPSFPIHAGREGRR